jgi:hypothetical protein
MAKGNMVREFSEINPQSAIRNPTRGGDMVRGDAAQEQL